MANQTGDISDFENELDSIGFQMPGSGGKLISFSDDCCLLEMANNQYPRWKEEGNVTSVPLAWLPKKFLHDSEMTQKLKKTFKSLSKGDGGEKYLFKLFVKGKFPGQPGFIIFPNFDTSEMFKTQVARKEIDMILVHQSYGIIVFNIKREGGKGTTSDGIKEDIEKHNKLIRMLMNYGTNQDTIHFTPIHTVICNFADKNKFTLLEEQTQNDVEKILVLNKDDLKPQIFAETWVNMIKHARFEEFTWTSQMDVLVARLIALSSAECNLAVIHDQMGRGLLQTVSSEQHLKTQITSIKSVDLFEKAVVDQSKFIVQKGAEKQTIPVLDNLPETSQITSSGSETNLHNFKIQDSSFIKKRTGGEDCFQPTDGNVFKICNPKKKKSMREKKKFILWTTDQLKVIAKVYEYLTTAHLNPSQKGLRLIVTGCKGSGKTMLLTFIAIFAQNLAKTESQNFKVLICDGGFTSALVLHQIRQAFKCSEVDFFANSNTVSSNLFAFDRAVEEEKLQKLRKELGNRVKNVDLMLCDEYVHMKSQIILSSLREDQHCVLFTSIKDFKGSASQYVPLHIRQRWPQGFELMELKASLRSTCQLTNFANDWIKFGGLSAFDYDCKPAHNFDGESLDIRVIKNKEYISQCVATINEYVQKSMGLKIVPVLIFLDLNVRESIVESLRSMNYNCQDSSELNHSCDLNEINQDEDSEASLPSIVFFEETSDLEGGEFGVVIILIHFEHVSDVPVAMKHKFFCAITRASTKLVILINNTQLGQCKQIDYETTVDERKCCLQKQVDERFQNLLKRIAENSLTKPTVLLVGRKPNLSSFKEMANQDSGTTLPDIEGLSLYVGEGSSFLHIEDVFEESDLRKLHNFGIQFISLTLTSAACPWQNAFLRASGNLIIRFAMSNRNTFLFRATGYSGRENDLFSIIRFCTLHSHGSYSFNGPTTTRSIQTFKNAPLLKSDFFRWHKWVEKGNSQYEVGQKEDAARVYKLSCEILKSQYDSEILAGNMTAAEVTRTELAKVHVRVAEVYLELAKDPSSDYKIFERSNDSNEFLIMEAISHALQAVIWDICAESSHEVFRNIAENIKYQYGRKTTELLDEKDVKKKSQADKTYLDYQEQIWRQSANFSSDYCPELQKKLTEFSSSIANYKRLPASTSTTDINAARKDISNLGIYLSREFLQNIRELSDDETVNSELANKLIEAAQLIVEYPIRLGFESLLWDPNNAETHSVVLSALARLQKIVARLQSLSKILEEEAHLIERTSVIHI